MTDLISCSRLPLHYISSDSVCLANPNRKVRNRSLRMSSFRVPLLLLWLWTLSSSRTKALCPDKPQLYFHQRGSVRELKETDSFITLTDVGKEFITCQASQNVEWVYEGNGEPSKFQEESSIQVDSEGEVEYCMTSKASIYHRQSDTDLAKHTGRYICREIGNSSAAVGVHVFVGRRNAPVFLHSRKTLALVLTEENVTDSSFLLPCGTSNPNVKVELFRESENAFAERLFPLDDLKGGENGNGVSFDPKEGFRFRIPPAQNLSAFYGNYKCVGSKGSGKSSHEIGEDFVIYSLLPPPTFRAIPAESFVYSSTILNFTCESTEEPVILKEVKVRSGDYDSYVYDLERQEGGANSNSVEDIEEIVEKNENKVHVANYLEMSPTPGAYGEIQCLSEKDKRVLHTWQYRVLGKKEERLSGIKFNRRDNSFSCRSMSGMPGRLSFVSCRTPSECRVNEICLRKGESCRGYSNATKALCHRGSNFCGKIFFKGGSGLIRCIGDGIDQIRGFTDESNDLRLRMGFHRLKPSETAFLSLQSGENNALVEGDEASVTLKLGFYYFLQPVQWAAKLRNGSSLHIAPNSEILHKTKLHRTIEARLSLPVVSAGQAESDIVGINVLIPLRSSVPPSWKTITLPLKVKGAPFPFSSGLASQEELEFVEGSGSGLERTDLVINEEESETIAVTNSPVIEGQNVMELKDDAEAETEPESATSSDFVTASDEEIEATTTNAEEAAENDQQEQEKK